LCYFLSLLFTNKYLLIVFSEGFSNSSLYSKEDLLTSPSFTRVIEDIGQLPNGGTFKITLVLVSEQNGEVKESDPVSTFFRTRM